MQHQQDAQVRDPYRGHEIRVWARRNERGAWRDEVQLYVDGARIELIVPEPAGPEWLTEDEALRAGVERGRYLVDKRVDDD
ncbi:MULTISPECIES: DUF6566 family protein [Burkholderia]|uniref:DUF6566 domain-containing protein n=5 Tax=Burkholderia cepacia complex TaxID=87882 RepID=A0A0H3KZ95_BURM1|nr:MULTISPECIES: DUF6566 family protein [Burkholderia]ABX19167.1 conserved hypothetical protein [Burkholderia multivorans ATCC 17616]AIO72088.1 hypothetical protein DM80_5717 [Burkholderia multivorans]AJY14961.1 hypothetical protein NP80_5566 [Burkholderia multivorans ATCC BAA-247]AOJ96970.1 citramalate synthase [Burkholderia multivorans]AOK69802.1 citramalate synthase [Burkholderia multivorans]